jgi:hypothetical protein
MTTWTNDADFSLITNGVVDSNKVLLRTLIDVFEGESIDTNIWQTIGANCVENGGYIKTTGTHVWDTNGWIAKAATSRVAGKDILVWLIPKTQGKNMFTLNYSNSALEFANAGSFGVYLTPSDVYTVEGADAPVWTGRTYTADLLHRVRIEFGSTADPAQGFKVYVYRAGDADFDPEYKVFDGGSQSDANYYISGQEFWNTIEYWWDIVEVGFGNAVFSIHDAGQIYMDAGANMSWDMSTFANTLIASPTITYQYATNGTGDAPTFPGDYSSALTLAQLAAETNTDDRYMFMRVNMSGNETGMAFDDLSATSYSTDTTPPAVPTGIRFKGLGDGFSLIWDEPADPDFSHCELRRDDEYLEKDGDNLAAWTSGTPTNWFRFADGDASMEYPASNFIDEGVEGTPTYYVRSVDTNGNKSAWVAFEIEVDSDPSAVYNNVYR